MQTLYNINQAAFILKVHPLTVRRYVKEGKLKAVKLGGNVRIPEENLQEFHKEVKPQDTASPSIKTRARPAKVLTNDDPFLKLKGIGASFHLTG